MKVVPTTNNNKAFKPVIPMDRAEPKDLEIGEYHTYKLRTNPAEADSPLYTLQVPKFDTGTPEEWLKFQKKLRAVIAGQNATTGPARYGLARNLLTGDALATFSTMDGNETVANFDRALRRMTEHIFPARALSTQRRYMRRFLRKPRSLNTREWISRVRELNDYLQDFPAGNPDTVPADYDYSGQKLSEEELLEILEFGIPNAWRKQMLLQNFDVTSETDGAINKFLTFCDRLESALDDDSKTKPTSDSTHKSNGKKNKGRNNKDTPKDTKKRDRDTSGDCRLHGENCGHSTHDCRTLIKQAQRMANTYKAQHDSKKKEYREKQEFKAIIEARIDELFAATQKTAKKARRSSEVSQEKEEQHMLQTTIQDFRNATLSDSESETED
jgi:hypothetical protein